jgi:6-phosphogluconate dehydrogenase
MAEAVYARCVSAERRTRHRAKKPRPPRPKKGSGEKFIDASERSTPRVSYAQGYMLMRAAAREYNWNLNYGGIALCGVAAALFGPASSADQGRLRQKPEADQPLLDDFSGRNQNAKSRNVISTAAKRHSGPAFGTALAFYDAIAAPLARLLKLSVTIWSAHLRTHRQTRANAFTPTGLARRNDSLGNL